MMFNVILKTVFLALVMLFNSSLAQHKYKESYYQNIWCKENKGITEYILPDKTRVDCLTDEYAVEFDFAHKWAESIGQSLYYSKITKKKPAIVLIMESNNDDKYYKRVNVLAKNYNISLFTMKSKDYQYYKPQEDIISEIINYFKNWLKLILINIVDKL